MTDYEDLIKAGIVLIIGAVLLSGTVITTEISKSFTGLGTIMIVTGVIVFILSIIIPFLKRFS